MGGRFVVVVAVMAAGVLACDCGNGSPGRDADAGEDRTDDIVDAAEDVTDRADAADTGEDRFEEADAAEAVDGDLDDGGERYIAPWDGDLDYAEYAAEHDCTPPAPRPECETPGSETPIWERSVGEEWCVNPIYRDLRPLWREVAPGCEQVTYLDIVAAATAGSDSYDVWDGVLLVIGDGVAVVDADCRSESTIQARESRGEGEGEFVFDAWPVAMRGLYMLERSWSTEAEGYSTVLVTYEPARRRKTLLVGQYNPDIADSRGTIYPLDGWGDVVLGRRNRLRESRCEFDIVSVDLGTGVVLDLSSGDLPFGRCVWSGSMWGNTGLVAGGSWHLHLVDVTRPGVREFGETAPCQWNAVIQGDTVCWEQTTEFCPIDTGPGNRIFCADLAGGAPWDASPVVTCSDGTPCGACEPTVFGPWVAWVLTRSATCSGNEIVLLNRRVRREYKLFEHTGDYRPRRWVRDLKLWGNHLYFRAPPADDESPTQIHRCDLRVLFPEAYE